MSFNDTNFQEIYSSLKNKLNFKIIFNLFSYQELSLTHLSLKCKVSKSTILRHLPSLFQLNIIELSRTKLNRGDRPAQYYQLSKMFFDLITMPFSQDNKKNKQLIWIRLLFLSQWLDEINYNLDSHLNEQIKIQFNISLHDPSLTKFSCIIDIPVSIKEVQTQSEDISKLSNNKITEKNEKREDIKLYKSIEHELRLLGIDIDEHISMENEKITKLDLIGLNLKAVPEFIKELKDLEHLNLENNLIEELPQFLDKMPNLKSIDVSKNPLNLTPERIDELNRKFLFYW